MSKIFIISLFVQSINAQYHFEEELFGNGNFRKADKRENATSKHLSSSTEDLMLLFMAEKEVIHSLQSKLSTFDEGLRRLAENYLQTIDYK